MSILTGRELEFLTCLSTRWQRLYFTELARLLEEEARRSGAGEDRQHGLESFESLVRLPS